MLTLLFFVTFGAPGKWLKSAVENILDVCTGTLAAFLQQMDVKESLIAFVVDGLCAGVGSVLSFLPVIGVLFAGLSLLEECGYMDFLSNLLEPGFRLFGLSGKCLAPMLSGFGCSVPAMMAAGRIPNSYERKITVFLIPYMSCSAKIPLYLMVCSGMFEEKAWIGVLGIYLTGGMLAAGILLVYKALCIRHGKENETQLPPNAPKRKVILARPDLKKVAGCTVDNMLGFVKKAFTIILVASTVIWVLENFDCHMRLVESTENSILADIGRGAAPIFKPLGLGDWRVVTALLSGLSAKEAVLSTITVLAYPAEGGVAGMVNGIFTPVTAASFLVFYLLYAPCAASLATVRKVTARWRYALAMGCFQTCIAWTCAFAVYQTGLFFSKVMW